MAVVTAAIIGAGATTLGGILGSQGQKSANQTNLQIARENRAWQEKMSSTANQRAAGDLEAAGLNRILALGKPASTPSGNIATMQNEKAPISAASAQVGNIAANTALQLAQAEKIRQETRTSATQATLNLTTAELKQSQDALAQMQTNLSNEQMKNVIETRTGITFKNKQADYEQQIAELKIPGVRSESQFYEMLMNAEMNEVAKAFGKGGPLVLAAIRAFFIASRGKR